ncbi:hypothetical protein IFM89_027030 [Coptis chinensis]|uniref:FACT complex subunit n=1 Tax=Coptis chinensis TaxID=261450 RepID=A0A835LNT0_9MAGN|nr:hypothetical protein IFM89_027030 [Coptis chinensis]
MSKEELRRQHQAELARQKNEETASSGDGRGAARSSSDLLAYKNVNDIPTPRDLMIQIDQKNEAILLPIYGSMVPFHVATVKSVSSQQDSSPTCYIRIIFNVPGAAFNTHDTNSLKFQGSIYLKEVASRESERAERATLVSQEKLQLAGTKFKSIWLPDLWIRPVFGGRGRKLTGTLEAHVNGFRKGDDYSLALSLAQSHHGGEQEDKGCPVLCGGDGCGPNFGRCKKIDKERAWLPWSALQGISLHCPYFELPGRACRDTLPSHHFERD